MPAIRHKGLGVIAHVSDGHPALSGSDWVPVVAEKPKQKPSTRRRSSESTEDE